MKSCLSLLIISVAIVHHLPYTCCTHLRQQRERKLNICEECSELLRETIEPVFDLVRNSSSCIEKYHGSPDILHNLNENKKRITNKQMVTKLQALTLELQMITEAWSTHVGTPLCLHQDLEKHFTRILCLLRPSSHAKRNCNITKQFLGPLNHSITAVKGYTSNYLRDVYMTLQRFVSQLQ